MKHTFVYKIIDTIDTELLTNFKNFVVTEEYGPSADFEQDVISVSRGLLRHNNPIFEQFVNTYMSKYFKLEGHLGSNIARMTPGGYVNEHTDYTGVSYSSIQDKMVKFQLPIITNPGAGLMWRRSRFNSDTVVNMKEGVLYVFDNCRVHSSVNFGLEYRYFLTTRWHIDSALDQSLFT